MIRILIIGRESARWGDQLQQRAGDEIEMDTARLPAAGLRQFEATPPDALVVVDTSSTSRAATLIAAVRERPLGQLIPVVVIAPPPSDDDHAEVDAWLSPNADVGRLVAVLQECLGVDFAEAAGPADAPAAPAAQASNGANGAPAYFIEEIDDDWDRPRRLDRDAIFSSPSARAHERPSEQARVDEEAVKRKLRAVRHEDYYAILEIRRGAEGAVVREAFHRLYRRFDPREIDFEVAHRMEDELGEIRDALEDAWAVLGDPKLREAYLDHTTRR